MTNPSNNIAAVLLCGGSSGRLGFAKEMLRVDGAPLAAHLVQRLRTVCSEVSVSTNHPEYLRYCVAAPVFADEEGAGPLAGIHAGLAHHQAEKILFLACDMPAVTDEMMRTLCDRAQDGSAPVILARADGQVQPLFGVYDRSLLSNVAALISERGNPSVKSFLDTVDVDYVDFDDPDARSLQDIDTPDDLHLLESIFEEVEPLPVERLPMTRFGGETPPNDTVVREWPFPIFANGIKLATILCMPNAVKELAVGFVAYLGLAETMDPVRKVSVDYETRRVTLDLDVEDARIKNAIQLLITSTCGANVYGSELQSLPDVAADSFRVRRSHILETIAGLRKMAPVFSCTGCTHQAAFSDGERIRFFYEDVGRHNAVDKIIGDAMTKGADLARGVLVTTGRLNSEMVIKAIRRGIPVLASRGAATTNAIRLAEKYGLTLAAFARAGRLNAYTVPERISDE